MLKINIRDARNKLSHLIDQVERGQQVILSRHGKAVAQLSPVNLEERCLPSLSQFRASIHSNTENLSDTIIKSRQEERY
jgi:prevent-host-death family protein